MEEQDIKESVNTEEPVKAEQSAEPVKAEQIETEQKDAGEKADKSKKVKIAIVVAGGIFILFAAVYAAAVAGGRTNNIPVAMPESNIVAEAEPTAQPTKAAAVPTPVVEEEEETPEDSKVALIRGNRRYDECVYADGGVVIVRKGDLYGAIDYEGNELAAVKYAQIIENPTSKGYFVLANSVTEDVTEENDGVTLSYSKEITTSTLFDNKGNKIFEGNNHVLASDDVYAFGIEDDKDSRKNRIEYYRFDGKNKCIQVMYVTDPSYLTGFRDNKTVLYGFTAIPTEDQDTNPTNLVGGLMDSNGKATWFAQAPGLKEFNKEVAKWEEDNKTIKTTQAKEKKAEEKKVRKRKMILIGYDQDGWPIEVERETLTEEEIAKYLEMYNMTDEEEIPEGEEEDEEEDEDLDDEEELTEEELDEIEEEADLSGGPQFIMDGILNAPVEGYFVTRDIYDVTDPYSFYDTKGNWIADIDTSYLQPNDKKGFVVGNFNNGNVDVRKYVSNGEVYWHYGSDMVLTIGKKDILIDASKVAGISDSVNDRMIVAVYDEIHLNDAKYWMYKSGNNYGYLDHKGKEVKVVFDDATDFVDGIALVVKDGIAYVIDEDFAVVEEIGPANSVLMSGDVMMVIKDGVVKNYILKEKRDNPQGKPEEKTSDKEAVTPTPEQKKKNK